MYQDRQILAAFDKRTELSLVFLLSELKDPANPFGYLSELCWKILISDVRYGFSALPIATTL
jgi:hypothetical protein